MYKTISSLSAIAALAATATAHGTVNGVTIDGVYTGGYKLDYYYAKQNNGPIPEHIGWYAENLDNGFVEPNAFGTADIICHKAASPEGSSDTLAKVAAGGTVEFHWSVWPESHVGPVITYVAPYTGDVASVAKEDLKWTKIEAKGYENGEWAAIKLIGMNNTWPVTVPETLAAGKYVFRHEIIALHGAGEVNGAQAYPQCLNIEVTGSGTVKPEGVAGTALYTAEEKGIVFNPYAATIDYPIPGPPLFAGASSGSPTTPTTPSVSAAPIPSGNATAPVVPSATPSPIATPEAETPATPSAAPVSSPAPSTGGQESGDLPAEFTLETFISWLEGKASGASSALLPYLRAHHLRAIPSPFPAAFTNLWLLYQARRGKRYLAVHQAHQAHGPLVRIQPHHISIASASAIPLIYGHGNGFLKSEYYDAFVSIRRGLFNTRDRAEHTRKRKTVSHTFSAKSVGQFEQYIHRDLEELQRQWDVRADAVQGGGGGGGGWYEMDALNWFNYLAFDVIGDLAFGAPFGMLEKGRDEAEVRMSKDAEPSYAPAIEVLNRRGEVSGTIGCYPALKPWAKYLPDPFFSQGMKAVENLAGIAIARVNARLETPSDRVDLLARLMQGRDETGAALGREELTAEALTQLIAGSDTTSNTSCALLYHCLTQPRVIAKLQEELDAALPDGDAVPSFAQVKDLPYVDAVIKETMRIHSTSSLGLPRLVPPGPGVTLCGHYFPPGTALSVPAYTIHHSKAIWGPDADEFRPERWEEITEEQKAAFIPFSYGPRACVGRNVAEMELALIVATVFRRYEFELRQGEMETREGFLRKPLGLQVGMRKRKGL